MGSYAERLNGIYRVVCNAAEAGVTTSEVVAEVPWPTNSHEVRAKLMLLRSQGLIRYSSTEKCWFVGGGLVRGDVPQ
jgi:hypothetical protein